MIKDGCKGMFGAKDSVRHAEIVLRSMSVVLGVLGVLLVVIGGAAIWSAIYVFLSAFLIAVPTFIPRRWRSMNRPTRQTLQSTINTQTNHERAYETMPDLRKARSQYLVGGALMTLAAFFAVFIMPLYPGSWIVAIVIVFIGMRIILSAINNEDKGKRKLQASPTRTA